MTIWITGANGFIGRHLVRELAEAGRVVHGAACFAIALSQQAQTLSKYGQRAMRVLRGGRMPA